MLFPGIDRVIIEGSWNTVRQGGGVVSCLGKCAAAGQGLGMVVV